MMASELIERLKEISHEERIPTSRLSVTTLPGNSDEPPINVSRLEYVQEVNAVVIIEEGRE